MCEKSDQSLYFSDTTYQFCQKYVKNMSKKNCNKISTSLKKKKSINRLWVKITQPLIP